MTVFRHPALRQLTDQQVRYAPAGKRLEQLARVEKLLTEIEAEKKYPYQYVCWRITDYRPTAYPQLLIDGSDLDHDLRQMIELLRPADKAAEAVWTLAEVSRKLNVSTKTIRRWKARGLIGLRMIANGRRQLGYPQSVVDKFLAGNRAQAGRVGQFSYVTDDEREDILRRARRLSRIGGGSLTEVSRRVARRLGRAPETIRCAIKKWDKEHPERALFPIERGPLDEAAKLVIYSSYRRGIAVDTLARRYHRTRTSMYRAINQVRAQRLLEQPLDYMDHVSFEDPAMEPVIAGPMPDEDEYEAKRRSMKAPKDVPPELAPMYEVPLLSKDQEQHLFRKMNFLKHKAAKMRRRLLKDEETGEIDPSRVRILDLKRIEELQAQANAVKDQLVSANMRLVANIAKRHAAQADNFWELMSDGNMSLLRAVEKFDFSRNFKFSTYASWAIMKNFARSIPEEKHRRERFVTGHEEIFEAKEDWRSDEHEVVAGTERAATCVNRLLDYLEPRKREIIRLRAGLEGSAKPMTLEEIGQQFGITKERVRQVNARAMRKLRDLVQENELEMP